MSRQYAIKIAVVDDDPVMNKLIARMLGNLGHTSVTLWENSQAVLALIDDPDTSPDLLILDLNMPGMDGLEFIRHLGERHYSGSVILFSGEGEPLLLAARKLALSHDIEILGYLIKPPAPEDLAALFEKVGAPVGSHAVKKVYSADEVRTAIAGGEMVNYYQPKVATGSGLVVGVEALVRWQHPDDGILLPERFIGVAEAHGLIGDLDVSVLANALAHVKQWQDEGSVISLSVNVSAKNLASPEFADIVAKVAADAGVPPQRVALEVSERLLMQEDQRALIENMARLYLKRFRLSIDEYGILSVPMNRLRDLPIDELKICMKVVHAAWADGDLLTEYKDCLAQARDLNVEVVAVGIEDMDDWNFVRRKWNESDRAQGHFIAKPMPAEDFPVWLMDWHKRLSAGFK